MQKGTIVEKLVEEVVKDSQHLKHLIGICEGNFITMRCNYSFIYLSILLVKMTYTCV